MKKEELISNLIIYRNNLCYKKKNAFRCVVPNNIRESVEALKNVENCSLAAELLIQGWSSYEMGTINADGLICRADMLISTVKLAEIPDEDSNEEFKDACSKMVKAVGNCAKTIKGVIEENAPKAVDTVKEVSKKKVKKAKKGFRDWLMSDD